MGVVGETVSWKLLIAAVLLLPLQLGVSAVLEADFGFS